MNLALISSAGITTAFFELAHSSNAHQLCSMNAHELQPIINFLGKQLASLAEKVQRLASYVYSKFPSFSLPVAAAHATPECDPSICLTPTGKYKESCHGSVVTYIADADECDLTSRCATIYEGLPHRQTSIRFSPRDSKVALENHNGTLVFQRSREETVNARLTELSETAATPEALLRDQEGIIGTLKAGDVLTVNSELEPIVISPEKWTNNAAFKAFQRIAKATGGIMGHSPSATSLNPLIEKMSAHILKAAELNEFVDIVFVLDTTSSMHPYIAQVQKNLVQFLQHLQEKKKGGANACRVALLEYRDKYDAFLNRMNTAFTSNFEQVQTAVKSLTTAGGGDAPEAVLDALLAAKNRLSWNHEAKRIVILIGDAPPQPKTIDGLFDEAAVIAQYQTMGTEIAVYPVFTET